MKKKAMAAILMLSMIMGTSLTVCAAPEIMADGAVFDAAYYAQNNPDVAAIETSNVEQVQPQEAVKKLLKKKSNCYPNGVLDGFTTYQYDAQGNMVRESSYNCDGEITGEELYSYDNRGNLVKEWFPYSGFSYILAMIVRTIR